MGGWLGGNQKRAPAHTFKIRQPFSVTQSCPTLRPHGLYPGSLLCPWNSPGKNARVSCHFHFLPQEIFPIPGLPHGRQSLYHLSHQGSQFPIRQWMMPGAPHMSRRPAPLHTGQWVAGGHAGDLIDGTSPAGPDSIPRVSALFCCAPGTPHVAATWSPPFPDCHSPAQEVALRSLCQVSEAPPHRPRLASCQLLCYHPFSLAWPGGSSPSSDL